MIILNIVKEKYRGVWTRVKGAEKSIIAYVLTYTTSANTVKEMKKLEKNTATNENKKIYSDHNSIFIILINLDIKEL